MTTGLTIRPATWPQDEEAAQFLLRNYRDFLLNNPAGPVEICLAGYNQQLAELPITFCQPQSTLLLAFHQQEPAGCVAIHQRADRQNAWELKRLWTEPTARGIGLGRKLMQAAIDHASQHGADTVLLDTVATAMPDAVRLYTSMGFEVTERHNNNPVPGLTYYRRRLR